MASTVSCPICQKQVPLNHPGMPFCSDRCRLLDLGNWASEVYVVPSPARRNELDELDEPDTTEGSNW